MSVKAAATEVLKKAKNPLHTKAIAEQIIAAGLLTSNGKMPEATVSASLYSDIKKNGDKSLSLKDGVVVIDDSVLSLDSNALFNLLHECESDQISDPEHDPSILIETKQVLRDLLCLIQKDYNLHFNQMKALATK